MIDKKKYILALIESWQCFATLYNYTIIQLVNKGEQPMKMTISQSGYIKTRNFRQKSFNH